jgi:hypothetical protein
MLTKTIFHASEEEPTKQIYFPMNGMSSAYISIELQADKKGQYFNADFPLLLQDKVRHLIINYDIIIYEYFTVLQYRRERLNR